MRLGKTGHPSSRAVGSGGGAAVEEQPCVLSLRSAPQGKGLKLAVFSVPRSPLLSPSLNASLHRETWPHLRSQEARARGAFHGKARGQPPPTLLGLRKMGPVLSYLAFEQRAEFKPKGRPNWLLPLSVAFALRCWKCLVHPFPSKPGPEKGPPAHVASSASVAHLQGLSAAWDQRASLFSRTRLSLAKGQDRSKSIWLSRLRDCLSPPHPAPSQGLACTWAHAQQKEAALQAGCAEGTVQSMAVPWRGGVHTLAHLRQDVKGRVGHSARLGAEERLPRLGRFGRF